MACSNGQGSVGGAVDDHSCGEAGHVCGRRADATAAETVDAGCTVLQRMEATIMDLRRPIPRYIRNSYFIIRDSLNKSFKEVFYKYVRPASGPFRCWTLHFNGERREDVVHRLKLLLSYVVTDKTFNEVYNFTDQQILVHMVNHYRLRDYDDFVLRKYKYI